MVSELLSAGRYLRARREAERLLREGDLSPAEEGRLYQLACRACLALDELFAAARFGERSLERARESRDLAALARAHLDLGCAYARIGDARLAGEHLHAFLALLPEATDGAALEGAAHYHLALVHRQRHEWEQAAQRFHRAAWLYAQHGRPARGAHAELEGAWCLLMANRPAGAEPLLAAVDAHLLANPDDQLAADLLCAWALYHRMAGDLHASTRLCREILTPGRPGADDHQRGKAAWIMGENALDLGHIREASFFAELALHHAARANQPSLMNRATTLRRRIAAAEPPA